LATPQKLFYLILNPIIKGMLT